MEKRTVGECFHLIRNGANIKQGVVDGGYPITRIETIANDKFNRDRMGYAGIVELDKYSSYVLEDGDLLMSHINSVQYLGRTVLYEKQDNETIIHGMNLLCLKADYSIVLPAYAKFYFYSHSFREQIGKITKKSVNQASFAVADLKKLCIELPMLEEQNKIVDTLNNIQRLIELRKQELQKLDELIKARFVEMFGDMTVNDKNWPTENMSQVCNAIGDGLHGTPVYDDNGEYPFINGNNLRDNKIVVTPETRRVGQDMYDKYYIDLDETTILLSINGTLGKTAIYNGENVILGKSACYLKISAKLNRDFVLHLLLSEAFQNYMIDNCTGTTIKNFGLKAMRNYLTIVPPLELQNKFVQFVRQVDKSKVVVQEALDKAQLLFDSLMQEYFG